MFTSGQLYFALFFIIVFVTAMIYVYRKDLSLHKLHYKGSLWILLAFFAFLVILFIIKLFLKE
ncbi:MAG: hypothetical protein E2604_02395 [Flavobacterium sp.]|nr:hypothetical protein [Flavobacterium sp.]